MASTNMGTTNGAYLRAQNPGLYEGLNDNSMKYVDVPDWYNFLQT